MSLTIEPNFEDPHKSQEYFKPAYLDKRSVRFPLSFVAVEVIFPATDALAIVLASLLGALGYQLVALEAPWNLGFHIGAGVAGATLFVLIRRSFGGYQLSEILSTRRELSIICSHWFLTLLLLASLAFIFKIGPQFSRGSIIYFAVCGYALLVGSRWLTRTWLASALRRGRVQGRRVVVFGLRDELALTSKAELLMAYGMTEVNRIAVAPEATWELTPDSTIAALLEQVLSVSRDNHVEEIVLALGWSDTHKIDLVRQFFCLSPLPLRLLPDQKIRYLAASGETNHALSIEIKRPPLSNLDRALKRGLDIGVALLALFLLLPLMLMIALAIKLDSRGPVLFRQQRLGFNSEPFSIFKFRTMNVMEDGPVVTQARRSDPRVTKIGRLLRRTSFDELPQLINVLLGEMSVVGPRPHAVVHDSLYEKQLAEYAYRHHVKPGITGWAQVNGCRGETPRLQDMERRLELDLCYINNWRLSWDVAILFRTAFIVPLGSNAY